jgi:hypothetical protein
MRSSIYRVCLESAICPVRGSADCLSSHCTVSFAYWSWSSGCGRITVALPIWLSDQPKTLVVAHGCRTVAASNRFRLAGLVQIGGDGVQAGVGVARPVDRVKSGVCAGRRRHGPCSTRACGGRRSQRGAPCRPSERSASAANPSPTGPRRDKSPHSASPAAARSVQKVGIRRGEVHADDDAKRRRAPWPVRLVSQNGQRRPDARGRVDHCRKPGCTRIRAGRCRAVASIGPPMCRLSGRIGLSSQAKREA